jgi:hypothetical protein
MKNTQICAICLEDDSNCELYCCGAQYHIVCISKWIQKQESDVLLMTSCPLCRSEVGDICKPQGTWRCFVWSLNRYMEGVYGEWRNTQDGRRIGSCACTLYFSYCLAVYVFMLLLFNTAAGLHGVFTWHMIGLAGMYTLLFSFLDDFFTSSDRLVEAQQVEGQS